MKRELLLAGVILMILSACMRKEDSVPLENNPASLNQNVIPAVANLLLPASEKLYTEGTDVKDSTSTVLFKWDTAANAASYKLVVRNLLNQTEQSKNTSDTTLGMTLKQNTPYSWYVVSLSKDTSKKKRSESFRFYNSGEGIGNYAPFPADSLSPTMNQKFFPRETQKITLSWKGKDVDNDNLKYEVYFGTDSSDLDVLDSGVTNTQYPDVPVSPDSIYYWKIVSVDDVGNKTPTAIYHFGIRPIANPHVLYAADTLVPQNGAVFQAKDTLQLDLSWIGKDEIDDIKNYDVYFGTDSAHLHIFTAETTKDRITDVVVHADSIYYWKVVSHDIAGQSSSTDVIHFKVIKPHKLFPAQLLLPSEGDTLEPSQGIKLKWQGSDEINDIIGYDLYLGTDSTQLSKVAENITDTVFEDASVSPLTTYYWKVITHDKAGNESVSKIGKFSVSNVVSHQPLYWDVLDNPEVRNASYYDEEEHYYNNGDLPDYIKEDADWHAGYVPVNNGSFVNNDYLAIPLGVRRAKWIQFTTPEIEAGTYKVWICYRSAGKDKKISISVDDDTLTTDFNFFRYMPKLGENGVYSEADLLARGWKFYTYPVARNFAGWLAGEVTFSTDGTHVIRFTVDVDNSETGDMNWLDMIQFIPVQMNQTNIKFNSDGDQVDTH